MSQFERRVAVVTGAGSGIGLSLAEELARRGAKVVLCDIHEENLEHAHQRVRSSSPDAVMEVLDVTDAEAVRDVIDRTVETFGRIDYLFNNAGIGVAGEARDVPLEGVRKVLRVNLDGVLHGCDAAYPIMVEQGFGHIINTASLEGLMPFPFTSSYVASKYAVVGYSNSLRLEGKDLGVRVSVVCPGLVHTPIFDNLEVVRFEREKLFDWVPNQLGVSPDDCAQTILSGVERNQAFIVVTGFAKLLWGLHRVSPSFGMWMTSQVIRHQRKRGIRLSA